MNKIEEDSVLDGNSLMVEFCIFCLALRVSFHIVFFRHYLASQALDIPLFSPQELCCYILVWANCFSFL